MKTITKVLCGAGVLALAGLVPYCVKTDDETGACKVKALLWNMEKTMEGEQATYVIDVLPFIQIGAKAVEEDIDEESDTE
ncbi:MAG: hypothetical protein II482_02595 [Lachnospiraceae bacterium]|nr:hypothetical protein [Lachnospiraceae bacterium]